MMTSREKMARKVFEVTLTAGQAEAVMLISAESRSMVRRRIEQRMAVGDICWEGKRDGQIVTKSITEIGEEKDGQIVTRVETKTEE